VSVSAMGIEREWLNVNLHSEVSMERVWLSVNRYLEVLMVLDSWLIDY
jgi:hypothetical protein